MATRNGSGKILMLLSLGVIGIGILWMSLPDRSPGENDPETVESMGEIPLASLSNSNSTGADPFDGWESEAFHVAASGQIKGIGRFLEAPSDETESALRLIVAESFRCSPLRPPGLVTIYQDDLLTVVRGPETESGGEAAGVEPRRELDGLLRSLRELRSPFGEADELRFYSKMVDVQIDEAAAVVTTVQHISFSGRSDQGRFEQHALWRMGWTRGSSTVPPRARSIDVESFEESRTRSGRQPLFSDCTESVFGPSGSYQSQLSYGVPYWKQRIEGYHHFYQFGHNGLAIGDVDGDGLEDVYLCQPGGLPNRLYLHQGDGTTREVAADFAVDYLDNTRSAILVDLDNDGDQDLILALTSRILFLENDGSGRMAERIFVRVSQAFSLAVADYDNDSDLDVYACVYHDPSGEVGEIPVPLPQYDANNGGENYLIRNDGNWRFADATKETGLEMNNHRYSFAAVWEDFDDDGDLDLYVANDYGRNNLYRQDSGKFTDVAAQAGVEDSASGMSVSVSDYNRDGRMDIYVANMFSSAGHRVTAQKRFMPDATAEQKARFRYLARGNTLFQNSTDGTTFQDVSLEAGVTLGRWGWSSLFADINNDGWEDLLVANGFVTGVNTDDL